MKPPISPSYTIPVPLFIPPPNIDGECPIECDLFIIDIDNGNFCLKHFNDQLKSTPHTPYPGPLCPRQIQTQNDKNKPTPTTENIIEAFGWHDLYNQDQDEIITCTKCQHNTFNIQNEGTLKLFCNKCHTEYKLPPHHKIPVNVNK